VKTRRGGSISGIAAGFALAVLALALVGCEGDDGSTGAQGPTGAPGPAAPPGESGTSIEDGAGVVIGDGSSLDEETIEAIGGLVATIDNATISSPPVLEFTVKTVHGGPAEGIAANSLLFTVAKLVPKTDGIPARWQSYINRVQTSGSGGPQMLPSAIQANSERGGSGVLEDLGEGKYRYTYAVDLENVLTPIAVSYEPSLTHRLGLEVRLSGEAEALAPDNPVIDVVPDGGAGSGHKLIAATENCESCHVRFGLHGGPRRSVEYCVTCHNPGSIDPDGGESVDLAYLAHSIHTGHDRSTAYIVYGFGGTAHDYGEVTYPQSTLFCESCHVQSAAAPDGDAWMVNS
jgi:OmcA/MtrC family decaheme c-type cytochrome